MATPADFAHALTQVLRYEGGYVNDPADPGGATNKGITQRTYDAWRTRRGLAARPVSAITTEEVTAIYRDDYWTASGADRLPMPLALIHFDTAVNMGVSAAKQLLAGAAGDTTAYLAARKARYERIAAARPASQKFLSGWLARVASLERLATPTTAVSLAVILVGAWLLWRALASGGR